MTNITKFSLDELLNYNKVRERKLAVSYEN